MPIRHMVVPAAGNGDDLCDKPGMLPNELLAVGRRPALSLLSREIIAGGFAATILVTSSDRKMLEDYIDVPGTDTELEAGSEAGRVGQGAGPEHRFFYVRQHGCPGVVQAILETSYLVGHEPFGVAMGDTVIWSGADRGGLLRRMVAAFEARQPIMVAAVGPVQDDASPREQVLTRANEADGHADITDILIGPTGVNSSVARVTVGRYVMAPAALPYLSALASDNSPTVSLADVMRAMAADGQRVMAVGTLDTERAYDLSSPEGYARAFSELSERDVNGIGASEGLN